VAYVVEQLRILGANRTSHLIAIGGGIIQDIATFTSSIFMRGISWTYYPTTLLGMVDSCVGGKSSINVGQFKDIAGNFYPPEDILIDTHFCHTLQHQDIISGLCEAVKICFAARGENFSNYLAMTDENGLVKDSDLSKAIELSLLTKKKFIEEDEFDTGVRLLLNFGHTFGHAIESLTNYKVPHGIAVSYGMDMSNFVSARLGYIPDKVRLEIRELLQQIWEGTDISYISVEKYKIALSKDKKNVNQNLGLILNKGYGKIFKELRPMDDQFTEWIKEYFTTQLT
jgi:3-dehydroquinate synthase